MLYPKVNRHWDGIYIEGQCVGLQLHPTAVGTISVTVIGMGEITGFDRPCRLSSEELHQFAPAEIELSDTRLECFAANTYAPVLRTGFTFELEPGMAPQVRAWLPRLTVVATVSQAIATKFSVQLSQPIHHMLSAITSVVARIVLDGWEVEHSVAFEREHGTWSKAREFMAQFDTEGVAQDLRALTRTDVAHQANGLLDINPTLPIDGA